MKGWGAGGFSSAPAWLPAGAAGGGWLLGCWRPGPDGAPPQPGTAVLHLAPPSADPLPCHTHSDKHHTQTLLDTQIGTHSLMHTLICAHTQICIHSVMHTLRYAHTHTLLDTQICTHSVKHTLRYGYTETLSTQPASRSSLCGPSPCPPHTLRYSQKEAKEEVVEKDSKLYTEVVQDSIYASGYKTVMLCMSARSKLSQSQLRRLTEPHQALGCLSMVNGSYSQNTRYFN